MGRQGSFNYIGTLDAMDIGSSSELVAKRLRKHWKAERLKTSFYPILGHRIYATLISPRLVVQKNDFQGREHLIGLSNWLF